MTVRILTGDCRDVLKTLPDESVHCVVTSPPYFGLRDYGVSGQIGLEESPDAFVAEMVAVFEEVRRALRSDGTCWVNLGDSYATSGGLNTTPHMGAMFADRTRGQEVVSRSKRLPRGEGRWGGGNNKAAGLLKPKDLIGIPWRVAFALQAAGWWLRQDIIWHKPNPMPESVADRCTKSHEYLFLLTKSARYHYDAEAVLEPVSPNTHARMAQDVASQKGSERVPGKTNGTMKAVLRKHPKSVEAGLGIKSNESFHGATLGAVDQRNKRSVWTVPTQPFKEAHFATFPPELVEPCIKAGCPAGGVVLDPFGGAGTVGLVADRLQRDAILIELNPEYAAMAERRIRGDAPMFAQVNP